VKVTLGKRMIVVIILMASLRYEITRSTRIRQVGPLLFAQAKIFRKWS
jgi:hypothetical protein